MSRDLQKKGIAICIAIVIVLTLVILSALQDFKCRNRCIGRGFDDGMIYIPNECRCIEIQEVLLKDLE